MDSETIKNESQADLNTPLLKEIKIGLLLSNLNSVRLDGSVSSSPVNPTLKFNFLRPGGRQLSIG